jgi:hypothetical protein
MNYTVELGLGVMIYTYISSFIETCSGDQKLYTHTDSKVIS